ncbi:MAG: radical SAM protein [Anaerolineales bacterium]
MTPLHDPINTAKKDYPPLDLPEGIPPLSSLYLYIARSCNLACSHCWIEPMFDPNGTKGQFIKIEYVEKAIREALPLGLRSVKLTGGEPTLHPQFRELINLLHLAQLDIKIETNGMLMDDPLALFLQENGISFISVSLDGATAEVHDALRGVSGSFERVLMGIASLAQVGYHPQVICTLHKGNIHEMVDFVKLANHLGCGSIKFNHVQRNGRGERFAEKQGLDVDELINLYRVVEKELVPNSLIPIFFDIPFAFVPINKLLTAQLGRCNVHNILGVLAGGELSLCGIGITVPELLFGQIEQDDLRDVWCSTEGLTQLRELIPTQLEGICGQCILRNLCQGECVANNFHISGRLNAPYYFCDQAENLGLFPKLRKR